MRNYEKFLEMSIPFNTPEKILEKGDFQNQLMNKSLGLYIDVAAVGKKGIDLGALVVGRVIDIKKDSILVSFHGCTAKARVLDLLKIYNCKVKLKVCDIHVTEYSSDDSCSVNDTTEYRFVVGIDNSH